MNKELWYWKNDLDESTRKGLRKQQELPLWALGTKCPEVIEHFTANSAQSRHLVEEYAKLFVTGAPCDSLQETFRSSVETVLAIAAILSSDVLSNSGSSDGLME